MQKKKVEYDETKAREMFLKSKIGELEYKLGGTYDPVVRERLETAIERNEIKLKKHEMKNMTVEQFKNKIIHYTTVTNKNVSMNVLKDAKIISFTVSDATEQEKDLIFDYFRMVEDKKEKDTNESIHSSYILNNKEGYSLNLTVYTKE